jgi:asparagine synthase (glutamine-hydrolysing)
MSGFVALIDLDNRPIDQLLLQQMTDSLAYRGPDARNLWVDGPIGFGHTMLRTTTESQVERQPHSLDGVVWMVGDVYIDGRVDLLKKLEGCGRQPSRSAPDAELVLHAYHAWGEECVQHLTGDFAFAVWNGRTKRLFCARDYFGVKPFYYAHTQRFLVFSNTLNCVRLHPAVCDELNDHAIGDFLLFGYNKDSSTTTFKAVRRLPPAHALSWSSGNLGLQRYHTLSACAQITYRRPGEYVEHFQEVWETAVRDRLRTNQAAVLMSGGLDSTSVAVTAHRSFAASAEPHDLRAYTIVYDHLIPHEERYYAGLVAEALRIPIHYLPADGYAVFERLDEVTCHTPEPSDNPTPALTADVFRAIARNCRLGLSGDGGDSVFYPPSAIQFVNRVRAGRSSAAIADLVRCLASGQRPPLGIRTALRQWRGNRKQPVYPPWVSEDFAARTDLQARWHQFLDESTDPGRTGALYDLHSPFWPNLFESYDPGVTQSPVEFRHPFFDTRVVTYLLGIPSLPWSVNKKILRDAMRGLTPESVRRRRKTPLVSDPISVILRQTDAQAIRQMRQVPELSEYVRVDKLQALLSNVDDSAADWHLLTRPLSLNHWLANARVSRLRV